MSLRDHRAAYTRRDRRASSHHRQSHRKRLATRDTLNQVNFRMNQNTAQVLEQVSEQVLERVLEQVLEQVSKYSLCQLHCKIRHRCNPPLQLTIDGAILQKAMPLQRH